MKRSVKEMDKINKILKTWEPPFDKTNDEAWVDLQPKLSQSKKGKVLRFSWKPIVSVAAAAAVIVMIVMVWPKSRLILRETKVAQTEVITLPDGSVMTLNASSSVSFNEDWSKERTLILDGQAFFNVNKGSKFSVVSENGVVEVLGTSFDVFARGDKFRVACYTGKVKVTSGESKIELTPGSTAERKGKALIFSTFNLADASWLTGEFIYNEEPLMNVMDELSRQFNVKIIFPDLSGRLYSGRFSNKDLNEALELVCLPMGLTFEIQGGSAVLITDPVR